MTAADGEHPAQREAGFEIAIVELERAAQLALRLRELAQRGEVGAGGVVDVGAIGREPHRGAQRGLGLVGMAARRAAASGSLERAQMREGEAERGFDALGIRLRREPVLGDGGLEVADRERAPTGEEMRSRPGGERLDAAQRVVVEAHRIGAGEREVAARLFLFAELAQGLPERVVDDARVRLRRQRALEEVAGCGPVALALRRASEPVERGGILAVRVEHPLEAPARLRQLARRRGRSRRAQQRRQRSWIRLEHAAQQVGGLVAAPSALRHHGGEIGPRRIGGRELDGVVVARRRGVEELVGVVGAAQLTVGASALRVAGGGARCRRSREVVAQRGDLRRHRGVEAGEVGMLDDRWRCLGRLGRRRGRARLRLPRRRLAGAGGERERDGGERGSRRHDAAPAAATVRPSPWRSVW